MRALYLLIYAPFAQTQHMYGGSMVLSWLIAAYVTCMHQFASSCMKALCSVGSTSKQYYVTNVRAMRLFLVKCKHGVF